MTALTPFSYLILDLRTCICTNYCVSCLSARPTACLCNVCVWILGPSDETRLYANNMQRIYTEYATKTRIEPTQPTGIYSFVLICAEYEIKAFDATSDEIRLMLFYLNPNFIDVSLKT